MLVFLMIFWAVSYFLFAGICSSFGVLYGKMSMPNVDTYMHCEHDSMSSRKEELYCKTCIIYMYFLLFSVIFYWCYGNRRPCQDHLRSKRHGMSSFFLESCF